MPKRVQRARGSRKRSKLKHAKTIVRHSGFSKRPSKFQVDQAQSRLLQRNMKLLNSLRPEVKQLDTTFGITTLQAINLPVLDGANETSNHIFHNAIAQGTAPNQRIGHEIKPFRLKIKLNLKSNETTNVLINGCHVLLYMAKVQTFNEDIGNTYRSTRKILDYNGATLLRSELVQVLNKFRASVDAPSADPGQNLEGKYRILHSKWYQIGPPGTSTVLGMTNNIKHLEFNIRLRGKWKYSTGAASQSLSAGWVPCLQFFPSGASKILLDYKARLYYTE